VIADEPRMDVSHDALCVFRETATSEAEAKEAEAYTQVWGEEDLWRYNHHQEGSEGAPLVHLLRNHWAPVQKKVRGFHLLL